MTDPLTPNAIHRLNAGDVDLRPILQVMDIRQIGNSASSAQERFRLVLSDGNVVQQAMLATQLNDFVKSKAVVKGTIVQLVEYICNTVQNRKIIIVLNMEIRQAMSDIIGNPVSLASGSEQVTGASNVQQQPQQQQQFRGDMAAPGRFAAQPQQPSYSSTGNNWEPRQHGGPPGQVTGGQVNLGNGPHNGYGMTTGAIPGYQGQRGVGVNSSVGGGVDANGFANASPYGRPLPPYQPPPMYSVKGPIARNEAPARIVPIAALNPYQGRWTVKARVTTKGDLRRFHNAKGEGKVFSFDLLDADGGEIRCTCFNSVADQFYEKIDAGRVYLISKGSLKPSQKQFNHLKNEWEVTLENASTVELCTEGDTNIPQQIFDFKPISDVEHLESNAMVDLVGVAQSISDSQQIMRKNGTETLKRSLTLTDNSGRSVELTMWGSFCNKEGDEVQQEIYAGRFPIIAVKAGRVSDFSGKSVGTLNTSQVLINPDLPEVHRLRAWHNHEGKNSVVASISKDGGGPGARNETRKFVSQIKDENLGRNEKPDWISVRATISFIKGENFSYTACPLKLNDKQCQKKVTNNGDGTWHCDRCDQTVPECDYRYLLQMQVQDHTGLTWVSGFQEAGEELFGVPAKDLTMWKQADNPKFAYTFQKVLFSTYIFRLKVKEETFQDEARVKCTVVKSEKVNFASESRLLFDTIMQVEKGGPTPTTQPPMGGYTEPSTGVSYGGGAAPYMASGYTSSYNSPVQGAPSYGSYGVTGGFASGNGASGGYRNDSFQGGGAASGACYKCGQGGHYAKDCPNRNFRPGGGGGYGGGSFGDSGYGGRGF